MVRLVHFRQPRADLSYPSNGQGVSLDRYSNLRSTVFEDNKSTSKDIVSRCKGWTRIESVLKPDKEVETVVAYAAEHWPPHFRAAQSVVEKAYVDELTSSYDATGDLRQLWFPIYWRATKQSEDPPDVNALQLAALLGHAQQVGRISQSTRSYGIDDVDQDGNTAVIWASRYGHETVVAMLLDNGADVNAQGGRYGNALYAASEGGHEAVVAMLLDNGATNLPQMLQAQSSLSSNV